MRFRRPVSRLKTALRLVMAVVFLPGIGGMHRHLAQASPPTPIPTGLKVLQAYPYEGHNGDTIYVSGTGFRPRTRLQFLITCPKWDDPTMAGLFNYGLFIGMSDAKGGFLAVPLQRFVLHGPPALTGSPCVIYVNYIGLPPSVTDTLPKGPDFVADINAVYTIVPSDQRLGANARSIHTVVTPRPKKVKAGLVERIHIAKGWGGAVARVTVTYPHVRPVVRTVRLDWKGEADVRVGITGAGLQPGLAKIQVRCRLGSARGMSFASFVVVR